ncbi:MAG: hypothetical protein RJB66_780 [Pseudomonadota bacterium]|jgi:HSP20 family molecular chaperone IbpA
MNFNKQKFFIALVCTALGWGVGYEMGKKKAEADFARQERSLGGLGVFSDPFWNPWAPPEAETETTPPSLFERFFGKRHSEAPSEQEESSQEEGPFSIFSHRLGQPQVDTREDENNVYMDIDLESFDKNSLSARVENGQVVIEGNQKTEQGGSSMSSHFYQAFPAPMGTDASKVDMSHENNKLILKFPKIK